MEASDAQGYRVWPRRVRAMSLTSALFRCARLSAEDRVAARVKNHVVGRSLALGGFWRMLFGGR
jgi:hypothetical protein